MHEFLEYHVGDFMSCNGVTVGPHAKLEEAERLFERHDFNLLPVLEHGRLIGVLTKLDLLKAFSFGSDRLVPRYHQILGQDVGTVMTREPVTVTPEVPLTRVLEKMVVMRYRSLPVIDGTRALVGVISREDIIRALRRAEQHAAKAQAAGSS